MRALQVFCLLVSCLAVAGCGAGSNANVIPNLPQAAPVNPPPGSPMLAANTYAGDALQRMLLTRTNSGNGILVASLVELDDFERTSPFGLLVSQQIASRLGQYGFRVLEARLGSALRMDRRGGEFMLTRDSAKLLADSYDAGSVLVGCYKEAGSSVYISVRVVRLSDNAIMGAYEYYLPRSGDVNALLRGGSGGGSSAGAEGDAVWRRYAARERAFAPERATAEKTASTANTDPVVATASAAKAAPARRAELLDSRGGTQTHSGGRVIDPAAPPTPFPGKTRR